MKPQSPTPDDSSPPHWTVWLKQQVENQESTINDQAEAEFADVVNRITEALSGKKVQIFPEILEKLKMMVARKQMSRIIADCATRQYEQLEEEFKQLSAKFPADDIPGNAELHESLAKAKGSHDEFKIALRVMEAEAKGHEFMLESAIKAITSDD